MAVINCLEKLLSIEAHQRFGLPNCYGRIVYGYNRYGVENDWCGIYQVRTRYGHRTAVRETFYRDNGSNTVPQQLRRSKFAGAVTAWQALTLEQKAVYTPMAYSKKMSGYNLFLSKFMKN